MSSVIVAFPKAENAKNIKNILVKSGYDVPYICTTGAQILQSSNRKKLFWLFLQDCYYFFRNEIRNECISKHLIEKGE